MGDIKNKLIVSASSATFSRRSHRVRPRARDRALAKFDQSGETEGRSRLVLGEIDYIRARSESRNWLKQASRRFSKVPDPLRRRQCLVLLGQSELAGERSLAPNR
jgi:hypothetical protein